MHNTSNHIKCLCVGIVTFCFKRIHPTAGWRLVVAPAHVISFWLFCFCFKFTLLPLTPKSLLSSAILPSFRCLHTASTNTSAQLCCYTMLADGNITFLLVTTFIGRQPTTTKRYGGLMLVYVGVMCKPPLTVCLVFPECHD